jgi:hypothetical protein
MNSEDGNSTGETVFLYQPKSSIVTGSLEEFFIINGVDEQKLSSLSCFGVVSLTPKLSPLMNLMTEKILL